MTTTTPYAAPTPSPTRDTPPDSLRTLREAACRSLASDLHDGPAQTLAYAALRLELARGQVGKDPDGARAALEQAQAAVRDTLRQVRALMTGLRPLELEGRGLVRSLRDECRAAAERGTLDAEARVVGSERRMAPWREHALYRAAREALLNAERHSGGPHAALTLEFGPEAVTVTVEDDGRGMDAGAADAARRAGRMGLANMRERVAALGGRMEMHTAAGEGTRIALLCPYEGGAPDGRGELI